MREGGDSFEIVLSLQISLVNLSSRLFVPDMNTVKDEFSVSNLFVHISG